MRHQLSLFFFTLFFSSFILYLLTLNPSITLGDTPEFIAAAYEWGVPHPTGYPLYTLVSGLLAHLPIGGVAWRVNSVSALLAALTVVATAGIVYFYTKSRLASLVGSFSLTLSFTFWLYAIHAEVYTLHTFFIALLFLLGLLFTSNKQIKYLYFLSLTAGLSLTNHFTILIFFPVLLFMLYPYWKVLLQPKTVLVSCLLFVVGLLPYLYIPFAAATNPTVNWNNASSLSGFMDLVTRKDYNFVFGHQYAADTFSQTITSQLPEFLKDIFVSFGGLAIIVGLLGFFTVKTKRDRLIIFLAFLFLGPLTIMYSDFSVTSPFPDVAINQKRSIQQLYLSAMPIIAVLVGLGFVFITQQLKRYGTDVAKIGSYMLAILILGSLLLLNFPKAKGAVNNLAYEYGTTVLNSLPSHSILITGNDEALIFWYLQVVEKKRPDIAVMIYSMMQKKWYVDQLKNRYPTVVFPFDSVTPNNTLDAFYAANLIRHPIYFSPLDDQSYQSISKKFSVLPKGLTVELIPSEKKADLELFQKINDDQWQRLSKNTNYFKKYDDLPSIEMQMTYARLLANAGWFYAKEGKREQAIESYERARKVSPAYYLPTERLAGLYLQRDETNYGQVIPLYEEILLSNPDHLISLRNLGAIYTEMRQFEKAKTIVERYLKVAPESDEKQYMRSLYSQLTASSIPNLQ